MPPPLLLLLLLLVSGGGGGSGGGAVVGGGVASGVENELDHGRLLRLWLLVRCMVLLVG